MKRIVIIALAAFFFLGTASLSAEAEKVKVDVYVVNVSKLDLAAGKYTANLEISLAPAGGAKEVPAFDLLNGEFEGGKVEETTDSDDAASGIRTYKATANLEFDPDFSRFPWDHQDLSIMLMVEGKKVDQVQFEAVHSEDESIAERANFPGWRIEHGEPSISETSLGDPKDKFSVYTFPIVISRNPLASFMKVFFPLIVMIIISFLAVFVGIGAVANRLTIVTGTLLGAVMFHLNATSSLPQIGYLTLADKVFMMTYISFLLNLGFTMIMWKKNESKQEEAVKKLYKIALYAVPGISAVLYIVTLLGIV